MHVIIDHVHTIERYISKHEILTYYYVQHNGDVESLNGQHFMSSYCEHVLANYS